MWTVDIALTVEPPRGNSSCSIYFARVKGANRNVTFCSLSGRFSRNVKPLKRCITSPVTGVTVWAKDIPFPSGEQVSLRETLTLVLHSRCLVTCLFNDLDLNGYSLNYELNESFSRLRNALSFGLKSPSSSQAHLAVERFDGNVSRACNSFYVRGWTSRHGYR